MSKMCGDTARHNRIRKQRILWRSRVRELQLAIDARKVMPAPTVEKPKA